MTATVKLTRRDAIAVLVASGIGASAVIASESVEETKSDRSELSDADVSKIVAVAEVVYPSAIEVTTEFVETYSLGRVQDRPEYLTGIISAASDLNTYTKRWYGVEFDDLSKLKRDRILREMGVDRAHPVPAGTVSERVRYYLVNDLLYALYSTPIGGELIGLENPPGHPGGLESYQRGPDQ